MNILQENEKSDLYRLFLNNVYNKPNEVMIYLEDSVITYKDALKMVNYYADEIVKLTNNKRTRILLNLQHNYKIIISILAVIKTGNSYVPTNKDDSIQKILNIARDCKSNIIISDNNKFENMNEILFDKKRYKEVEISEEYYRYDFHDEVYVLFTSGSTGQPKGCSITYRNLLYIIENIKKIGNCSEDTVWCFSTKYTFDVSTTEIYSFAYGAKVFIYDICDYQKLKQFPDMIKKYNVTHLALSPSFFKNIINLFNDKQLELMNNTLKCVMIAGEAFKKEIYDKWEKEKWPYRLLNLYGPTEATVYSTIYELQHGDNFEGSIPIGTCLKGCDYYIDRIDEKGIGELILCGRGIANGYINNKEEDKKRFFYNNGIRCYRTGDLVSQNNGLLYYHGRNDNQIQINGIRVELGEIEARIVDIEEVQEVVVIYNNGLIIATVSLNSGIKITSDQLKEKIKTKVPIYMVPNRIRFIEEFPLNTSNKIDRKKILTDYLNEKKVSEEEKLLSSLDSEILNIMTECLTCKTFKINIDDDFYENGGDSLATFILVSKLEEKYKLQINVDTIYRLKTAKKISEYIKKELNVESKTQQLKGESSELLTNIISLTKEVKEYIYSETEKKIDTYESIHIQKGYYFERFNSVVSFNYDLGENYTYAEVRSALVKLLQENKILYSKINCYKDKLYFEEYEVDDNIKFPEINIDMNDTYILDFIQKNYEKELFYSRYNNGYLAVFIIVKCRNNINIIAILDHTIADASCASLIKIKLSNILLGNKEVNSNSYKDYCTMIRDNNSNIDLALNHWYVNKIKKAKIENVDMFLEHINNEHECLILPYKNRKISIEISKYIAFVVANLLKEHIANQYIAIRTIFNLREYEKYSFKNTLGDVHVGMSFIYKRHMDFSQFNESANKVMDLFSKEVFRPSFLIADTSINKKKKQSELAKIMHDGTSVYVNYLGEYDNDELDELKRNIRNIHNNLYAITKAIYVTAVSNRDKLYIFINKKLSLNS